MSLEVQGVAHWFGQTCKRDVGAGPLAYMLAHLLALLALPLYIFPMLSAPYIARVASALRCVYFFAHLFACSLLSSWDGVGFDVPVLSCFEPYWIDFLVTSDGGLWQSITQDGGFPRRGTIPSQLLGDVRWWKDSRVIGCTVRHVHVGGVSSRLISMQLNRPSFLITIWRTVRRKMGTECRSGLTQK